MDMSSVCVRERERGLSVVLGVSPHSCLNWLRETQREDGGLEGVEREGGRMEKASGIWH